MIADSPISSRIELITFSATLDRLLYIHIWSLMLHAAGCECHRLDFSIHTSRAVVLLWCHTELERRAAINCPTRNNPGVTSRIVVAGRGLSVDLPRP